MQLVLLKHVSEKVINCQVLVSVDKKTLSRKLDPVGIEAVVLHLEWLPRLLAELDQLRTSQVEMELCHQQVLAAAHQYPHFAHF